MSATDKIPTIEEEEEDGGTESSPSECYIDDFVDIRPGEFYDKQLVYLQKILSNRKGSGIFELLVEQKYKTYFPNHLLRMFRYGIYSSGPLRYCIACFLFFYTLACETELQIYVKAQIKYAKNKNKLTFYETKFLEVLFIETEKLMASALNETNALLLVSYYNSHLSMLWKMQNDCSPVCDAIIAFNQIQEIKNEQEQESKKRATVTPVKNPRPVKRETR